MTEADLLKIPQGPRTEACLRNNCVVGVQYLEAWLGGLGCVPLYNLMEDAATAEICRTQVRSWLCLTWMHPSHAGSDLSPERPRAGVMLCTHGSPRGIVSGFIPSFLSLPSWYLLGVG